MQTPKHTFTKMRKYKPSENTENVGTLHGIKWSIS